jgi:tRNA(fMet)-specific endonuclease VapC
MAATKLFKIGNSQAVRIPAELAYPSWDIDLVIERDGDELRIRPAQRRIGDVLAELEYSVACSGDSSARNQAALEGLLDDIVVAAFEARAARAYEPLRAANRDRNKDALDQLIASHAVALGVTLVRCTAADGRNLPAITCTKPIKNVLCKL